MKRAWIDLLTGTWCGGWCSATDLPWPGLADAP